MTVFKYIMASLHVLSAVMSIYVNSKSKANMNKATTLIVIFNLLTAYAIVCWSIQKEEETSATN